MVDPMKLPDPSNHVRPCRPRPATCRSATSQCPPWTVSAAKLLRQIAIGRAGFGDDADHIVAVLAAAALHSPSGMARK